MKSTRDGFGDQLVISAKDNKNILALCADLGKATKLDKFKELYPDRFFDVGIAENNMIGIASGLSEHGYKVFLASFSAFLTGKYDTIRCSIAYPNCPVILVGTHGGLAIGKDGVTQMGLEDIAIMRVLPNMTVLNPATYNETVGLIKYLCETELKGPVYLRLGRQPVKEVYDEDYSYYVENRAIGINMRKDGTDGVVFCTGCILPDVLEATENLYLTVISLTQLKPMIVNKEIIEFYVNKFKHVFTVEDHSIVGGLGSIIAEIMAETGSIARLIRMGVNDVFPESGKTEDLYEKYGLSASKIRSRIEKTLSNDNK